MPEFAYTARSVQGQDSSGVIAAGSRREAIALLAQKSLFPLQVEVKAVAGATQVALAAAASRQERRVGRHVYAAVRPVVQWRGAARVARHPGAAVGR